MTYMQLALTTSRDKASFQNYKVVIENCKVVYDIVKTNGLYNFRVTFIFHLFATLTRIFLLYHQIDSFYKVQVYDESNSPHYQFL